MLVRLSSDWRLEKWLVVKLALLCFPPSLPALCFNIRALAMAVFMQALSCFFSSPLVPSCPPSLPGTRVCPPAVRKPRTGVEQVGPGDPITPGNRKAWHQRRNDKIAGHAGSAAVAAPALRVRRPLASINRFFSSASIQPVHNRICLSKTNEHAQLVVREHRLGLKISSIVLRTAMWMGAHCHRTIVGTPSCPPPRGAPVRSLSGHCKGLPSAGLSLEIWS
ncbi:hypothetical protein B0T18DRAFT_74299 [Schizothecium vesticola]|uniref:Uncharacterized protein n=1 Tax=Schizothecium vesticola TaxID=314040 RepID=A0AA40KA29_9PEZI|nr:hypothetical protein B0T18DRAFT_74299 [Schizothecium vesticola]